MPGEPGALKLFDDGLDPDTARIPAPIGILIGRRDYDLQLSVSVLTAAQWESLDEGRRAGYGIHRPTGLYVGLSERPADDTPGPGQH